MKPENGTPFSVFYYRECRVTANLKTYTKASVVSQKFLVFYSSLRAEAQSDPAALPDGEAISIPCDKRDGVVAPLLAMTRNMHRYFRGSTLIETLNTAVDIYRIFVLRFFSALRNSRGDSTVTSHRDPGGKCFGLPVTRQSTLAETATSRN